MSAFFVGEDLSLMPPQPFSAGTLYSVIRWPALSIQQMAGALGVTEEVLRDLPPNGRLDDLLAALGLSNSPHGPLLRAILMTVLHFTDDRTETREFAQVAAHLMRTLSGQVGGTAILTVYPKATNPIQPKRML